MVSVDCCEGCIANCICGDRVGPDGDKCIAFQKALKEKLNSPPLPNHCDFTGCKREVVHVYCGYHMDRIREL